MLAKQEIFTRVAGQWTRLKKSLGSKLIKTWKMLCSLHRFHRSPYLMSHVTETTIKKKKSLLHFSSQVWKNTQQLWSLERCNLLKRALSHQMQGDDIFIPALHAVLGLETKHLSPKKAYLLFTWAGYYFLIKHCHTGNIAPMQLSYLPLNSWWWRIMQRGTTGSYSYLPWVIKGAPNNFARDQVLNPSDT